MNLSLGKYFAFGIFASSLTVSSLASADFLPENNLHLQDNFLNQANITEQEFNEIVNNIVDSYQEFAKGQGAKIKTNNAWSDSTVNASAQQMGSTWVINMYGGLARRDEVTPDGFALVVCHELGHHFGGFPFRGGLGGVLGGGWAANEGQSDYFATQACARRIWKNTPEENEKFAAFVPEFERSLCDGAWTAEGDRNLCYRTLLAGQSLGNLLAVLKDQDTPDYTKPDGKVVPKTDDNHPAAQCRLDTYLAGALCATNFDPSVIPARKLRAGQGSRQAEIEALKYSCPASGENPLASRPKCWFASKLSKK